jgi:hypothetical protein
MRFTLIYQGDLPPNGNARDKWRIRRELEPQLRRLWELPPLTDVRKFLDPDYKPADCYVGQRAGAVEYMPLITDRLELGAELEVRLLSAAKPGGLLNHCGDIDNRLKTLFDALSIPTAQQQLADGDIEPDGRLFCLLQDDRLVTRVDVANDRLLTVPEHSQEALVIIRVQPVAFRVTTGNLAISG